MRNVTLTIDLYAYTARIIELKQYDTTNITLTITERGEAVSLSGYTFSLTVTKPNGDVLLQVDTPAVTGNVISWTLDEQAVTAEGNVILELALTNGSGRISTYIFGGNVAPSLVDGVSSTTKETLTQEFLSVLTAAQNAINSLNNAVDNAAELLSDIDDISDEVTAAQTARAQAQTFATNAGNSASAASESAVSAGANANITNTAKEAAQIAQAAAETAQAAAEGAQTGAETAETNAGNSATAAAGSAAAAAGSATDANAAKEAAQAAQAAAETAQGEAEDAQAAAEAAQTAAEGAQTGAETAETNAGNSATAAADSATAAAGSATDANTAKEAAQAAQAAAETAQGEAEDAQAAAEAAQTAAESAATTAVSTHNTSPTAHENILAAKADKLTAGSFTNGNIIIAGEGGIFADSGYPVFMDVITDPAYIQNATRKGTMRFIADVGDSFEVSRGSDILTYDFIGFDADTPADAQYAHATTVQLHNCYKNLQFDAPELLFYVNPTDYPNGLAAGTYNITLDHGAYGGGTGEDGTYQFTTAQAIPAGGGFRHTTAGAYHADGYAQANITGGTIATYDASGAAVESDIAVTVGTGGTNLGTFSGKQPAYRSGENCNYTERNAYGSNNYENSAIRQWLNSNAAAGGVWTAKTIFDRAPSWAASEAGFKNGIDADFLAVLGAPVKRTARNTFTGGGGYVDISTDLFFLLSRGEIGGANENGINEGSPYEYYAAMLINNVRNDGALAGRIKYLSGSPRYWWLRSPYASNSSYVRSVRTSGSVDGNNASSAYGVAPACCII